MKRLGLIFTSLLIIYNLFSQNCLTEGITFRHQIEIDNFSTNFPNCKNIDGSVMIIGDDITNLHGLNQLFSISEDLSFGDFFSVGNPRLKNFKGLENLDSIGGTLAIYHNDSLTDLEALSNLSHINYGLWIVYNASLKNLNGLQKIEAIKHYTVIGANDSLQSLLGLDNLETVRNFSLELNPNLSDLTNLKNLKQIEMLIIKNNPRLTSLAGFDNLDTSTVQYVQIKSNENLSKCEVKFICDYLSNNISYEIVDNNSGCNNYEEIKAKCESIGIYDIDDLSNIVIYPNPTSKYIKIDGLEECDIINLIIYDQFGKKLLIQNINDDKIDVSNLDKGLYFLVVNNSCKNLIKKFIIN